MMRRNHVTQSLLPRHTYMTIHKHLGGPVRDTTAGSGRHRLGSPGLTHVAAMMTVLRRGFFASLWTPGKHRQVMVPPPLQQRLTAAQTV